MIPQSAVTPGSEFGRSRLGRVIAFVAAVSLPLVLGGAGGVVTAAAIPGWYAELSKPSWNPPSWVFGPVWTALYICMAVAMWLVWKSESPARNTAAALFVTQLLLNALWSWLFFGWHRPDAAAVEIVVLWATILATTLGVGAGIAQQNPMNNFVPVTDAVLANPDPSDWLHMNRTYNQQRHSPLGRGVSLEDLGGAGLYLLSELSGGVTGEIHFVDSGYNIIAMPQPDALRSEADETKDAAQ